MSEINLLWEYYLEQRESAKAFDNQRTSIANFVITVAGVLIGLYATKGFSESNLIVFGFVTLLGAYGMAATRKLYECSSFCMRRGAECLFRISEDQHLPYSEIKEAALVEQRKQFKIMSRVRLHVVWMVLHGLIFLFGAIGGGVSLVHLMLNKGT